MQLVERLQQEERWLPHPEVEWLVLERPGASLLQYFDGVETVCIVDALSAEGFQGVRRIAPEELLAVRGALSSHNFGVAEGLGLAAALGLLPERLFIYGCAGEPGECLGVLQSLLEQDLLV